MDGERFRQISQLIDSTDDRVPNGDPLVALATTVEVRKGMERAEAVLVRRARNQGSTWADIAAALGVSKQAIHKKYGGRNLFGSEK